MRTPFRFASALLLVLLAACARAPTAPYPHESTLSVLAELKVHLRSDPYSEPPGMDLEGRNIFRVSIERLDALAGLAGPDYADILAFARAECLERVGLWAAAADAFAEAARPETSLAEKARAREASARKLAEICADPAAARTVTDHLNSIDARRARLLAERDAEKEFPYASYINAELERALRDKALFLFANRLTLPKGAEDAIKTAAQLAEENPRSWRRGANQLLLGRLYESLATDYAELNDPSRADFDQTRWSAWTQAARAAYLEAANADGDPAKPEGQARLRALDAFAQRVLSKAR